MVESKQSSMRISPWMRIKQKLLGEYQGELGLKSFIRVQSLKTYLNAGLKIELIIFESTLSRANASIYEDNEHFSCKQTETLQT
jgi:hypothetical protein